MTDSLAVSPRNAAYMLFEQGFTVEQVQRHLDTLKPVSGYYYASDILNQKKHA